MRGCNMKMTRIKENELPAISDDRRKALEALAQRPDSEINFDDIPPLAGEFWKNAVSGAFYKPKKTHTSIRIDADVLAWIKSKGSGYQTKINAILRQAMLTEAVPKKSARPGHSGRTTSGGKGTRASKSPRT